MEECSPVSNIRSAKVAGQASFARIHQERFYTKLVRLVQIFGIKQSQATRAAERFFKERRVEIHYVDLTKKPMAPEEIRRFLERFGLAELLDTGGKAWIDAGLKYLKVSDAEMLQRIEKEPKLLRLPLIRCAGRLSAGHDEDSWKAML